MALKQSTLIMPTTGRGLQEVTREVMEVVKQSGLATGLCHVFLQHTSASLILCENADPTVLGDLETFMAGAVVDADARFRHRAEGADDMSAHIRSVLTGVSLQIPILGSDLALGTWQGIYLWEHRVRPHKRRVVVTVWDGAP